MAESALCSLAFAVIPPALLALSVLAKGVPSRREPSAPSLRDGGEACPPWRGPAVRFARAVVGALLVYPESRWAAPAPARRGWRLAESRSTHPNKPAVSAKLQTSDVSTHAYFLIVIPLALSASPKGTGPNYGPSEACPPWREYGVPRCDRHLFPSQGLILEWF